jgi:hypothetical protein
MKSLFYHLTIRTMITRDEKLYLNEKGRYGRYF